MPSSFSTLSSTGRPWVSHPALRFTWKPFMVLNRQKVSFSERASTWWIPGCPLADGGPSKKMNEGQPSLSVILLWNTSSASHCPRTSRFTSLRFSFVRSANFLLIYCNLFFRATKLQKKILIRKYTRMNFKTIWATSSSCLFRNSGCRPRCSGSSGKSGQHCRLCHGYCLRR